MTERFYSSTAITTALASPVDDSSLTISVNATTGFPNQFPYTLALDIDTSDEELVDVTSAAGTTLTVTRGVDGTVGLAHEAGAVVKHALTGRDAQDSRDHEESDTGVHGLDGGDPVVGETTVATLEGKTIDGGDNTLQNVPQSAITDLVSDQATQDSRLSTNEGNISSLTTSFSNHENDNTNVHGVGVVVGLNEAQTPTNKTMSGSSNTFINIGQGSIVRGLLNINGEGTNFNMSNGQERLRNSFTASANVGGFVSGPNSSEWILPFDGMYLISQSGAFTTGGNSEEGVELRIRVNGTPGVATSGTLSSRAGGNFAGRNEAFVTQTDLFGPTSAGTLIKFTAANLSGLTIADLGSSTWKHAHIIYLGPVG